MNIITVYCAFILLGATVFATPVHDEDIAAAAGHIDNSVHTNERAHVEEALLTKLNGKCTHNDVSSCIMIKLITSLNRMLKKSNIDFGTDVEVTQTASVEEVEDMSRNFKTEDKSEEGQVTELIADKLWTFVRTRSLKWRIMDTVDLLVSSKPDKEGNINLGLSFRDNGEGRKKGEGGNMQGIMAAAVLKIGLLKALAFKALVMLVGKALIVSKMALVLAAVIGLKKLFHQEKHVTYEVVAHPHHSHEHTYSSGGGGGGGGHDSYSSGWGRSLAYRAHAPTE